MKEGGEFYHHAASTLQERCRKKLTENTTWYRRQPKNGPEEDGMENIRIEKPSEKEDTKVKKPLQPLQKPKPSAIKAVMFIPYTPRESKGGRRSPSKAHRV